MDAHATTIADPTPEALRERETQRQAALDDYAILDTLDEAGYDDVTKLAAAICDTPVAMITFIDQHRQWAKSMFGEGIRQLSRATAFCARAIETPDAVTVIPDAAGDATYADNPLVTQFPKIRFYAGAPLVTPAGQALGTICVIDQTARQLRPEQVEALRILSRQVITQLELRRSLAALAAANDQLTRLSMTDALTGVANRRAFNERIEIEVARAQRTGDPLSLVMFDLDHFKSYNQRHGHLGGDAALHQVGEIIKSSARPYDFAARYGGEEFAVILSKTPLAAALRVAERLRRAIAEGTRNLPEPVTASMGAATLLAGATAQSLIAAADGALYDAKSAGRNTVLSHDAGREGADPR
jgi:diguanylate cyclase (GGDEF)-like protein